MSPPKTFSRMAWLVIGLLALARVGWAEAPIDFSRDVRPIFNRHCASCHGGVKQAGGLSFVYRDRVLGKGKSGRPVVVAGDLAASELIRRVTTKDLDDRMPPVEEHPEGLSASEIDTLKRWVAQGAAWGEHWAFAKPRRRPAPSVSEDAWCRNEIDRFVLARLDQENLRPSAMATPELWLRRVSLALTGLPPSPEQRREFLDDQAKRGEPAYVAAVDRLLASPGFGERWASVWLDQVRYADSRGLGQDGRRNIWKYRDWVIDAFNRDLPFNEFTIQQIAGDLRPNRTVEDVMATAGHRATQSSEEGGTDDEEFRVAAVLDRVNTTWQTWQGLTFGCVQCHDHPYDPIRHEEFYKFAAFFNNTADCDLDEEWPVLQAPLNSADYPKASQLDRAIDTLCDTIWRREYSLLTDSKTWKPLAGLEAASSTATKVVIERKPDHDEFHTVDTITRNTDITLEAPLPVGLSRLAAIRFTAMPLEPEKAVSDSEWGFVLSHIETHLVVPGDENPRPIKLAHIVGDESNPFHDPRESLNAKSNQGFSAYSRIHYPRQAAFILENPMEVPPNARLRVKLKHRVMLLGAFSLVTRRGHLAVSSDPQFPASLADENLQRQKAELAALRKERAGIRSATVPVLEELPARLARPTHVFIRGLFLTKDKPVTTGVPSSFPPLPTDLPPNRLALAQWLVSSENPLTTRVAVNRFWSRLFGIGLVATEEDFGSSGEQPSHPELLDYLALRFQNELHWSSKSLLKEIVLSSTYRQSSAIRPELLERDPQNRLLAIGPRHRLPAEMIRDQALAIAGLLSEKQFGPPVHPPIPDGVWLPFQAGDRWRTPATGNEDRYRRSIYTYTKRSIPYPMFAAFDAPSREFCAPRRLPSNTPLQALMTLNDETFAECSKSLARRMKADGRSAPEDQLAAGYLLATGRTPSSAKLAELTALFSRLEERYRNDPEPLKRLEVTPADAALAVAASVLLNLDEVLNQ